MILGVILAVDIVTNIKIKVTTAFCAIMFSTFCQQLNQ